MWPTVWRQLHSSSYALMFQSPCASGLRAVAETEAAVARSSGRGPGPSGMRLLFTIGHSTRSVDEMVDLLKDHGVTQLVECLIPAFPRFKSRTIRGRTISSM